MDANMDELLDLCTGKFASQAEKPLPGKSDKREHGGTSGSLFRKIYFSG